MGHAYSCKVNRHHIMGSIFPRILADTNKSNLLLGFRLAEHIRKQLGGGKHQFSLKRQKSRRVLHVKPQPVHTVLGITIILR